MRSVVLLVLALSACATQPEQKAVPITTVQAKPVDPQLESFAKAMANTPRMEDISCLTTEQQAEFNRRRNELIFKSMDIGSKAGAAAMIDSGDRRWTLKADAQEALRVCEANVAPGEDKAVVCAPQRRALEKVPANPAVATMARSMISQMATAMKETVVLRAEYPACGNDSGKGNTTAK